MATTRPSTLPSLTLAGARRLALAAQGMARPAPARTTPRSMRAVLDRLGAIQIDSINVVGRSHELVLAARVNGYDPAVFDDVVYRRRHGFEYWGHAASFMPMSAYRLFLPRMRRLADSTRGWFVKVRTQYGELYGPVLDRIRAEGPLPASAFNEPGGPKRGSWWDWAPAKHVLEDLYDQGTIMVADRVRFERRYDLAERILPSGLDLTEPTETEAAAELLLMAASALGVGTAADLTDYFRLRNELARPALAELTGSGLLEQVEVQSWAKPAYVLPGAVVPRVVDRPPVMVSPFDAMVWYRDRAERLFDFTYRLEVYVPAPKRVYGYYTMPVLAGDRFVARVDPKHDRATGRLLLRAAHLEPGVDPGEGMAAVAAAARRLAGQLGAAEVTAEAPDPLLALAVAEAGAPDPALHQAGL
jgi:uncharacterized protein YcaQ